MTNMWHIPKYKTKIKKHEDWTLVYFHDAPVVTFNGDWIVLNTGGWKTPTTKTRMNQVSNVYNLEYKVFQVDFEWYVEFRGVTLEYEDRMIYLKRHTKGISWTDFKKLSGVGEEDVVGWKIHGNDYLKEKGIHIDWSTS